MPAEMLQGNNGTVCELAFRQIVRINSGLCWRAATKWRRASEKGGKEKEQ
jgi:hypothetical protein